MSTRTDVHAVLEPHALNGEGPQWDVRRGVLWWVDMRRPSLNRFDPATGRNDWWETPGWVGCFGILEDGRLAAALRTGLHLFDPEDGSLRLLAGAPCDPRRFALNDGGCDRQGRFHVGPMHHQLAPCDDQHASPGAVHPLWRYDGEGRWTGVSAPVEIANGLAFSPDGRTRYRSDTPKKTIYAADYDPDSGEASRERVFARVEDGGDGGGPDGAVVDRDGFYTCAVFGGGCLKRFDPEGRLERTIELPVRYPTMPALGGGDLATLYVTCASYPLRVDERQEHPLAGGLLQMEAPAPGLPTSYMAIPQELRA